MCAEGIPVPERTDERFRLLVNPAAGGGRARGRLPAVESALSRAGADYELVETESLAHACNEAVSGVAEGRIPVVMSGDGMIGAVGGKLAGSETPLGVIPGGRGNDLARVVGIPTEPAEAVANLLSGQRRRIDVGEANGIPFLCIASCGFDSDANRIANEAKFIRGSLVYAYAALRALAQWKPATFTLSWEGGERSFRGYSVAAANSQAYGGGMFVAPDAVLDDAQLDVVTTAEVSKLSFLRGAPRRLQGSPRRASGGRRVPLRRARDHGRPPIRRLRRRRAADRSAGDDPHPAARARADRTAAGPQLVSGARRSTAPRSATFAGKRAFARAVGGLSRLSGRGGGTTLPGRLLLRTAPDAIERLGSRLQNGSAVISATNGKTTTAGMIAAALDADGRRIVHNRAGSNMAWGVATALLEGDGDEGLFEVDEAWLPKVSAALHPRLLLLANLFRDQLDRYGELERLADDWAVLIEGLEGEGAKIVLNADDPLVADLGPRPGAAAAIRGHLLSGSMIPPRPCRSSMPSTPSTAGVVARPTSTTVPSSVTSATTAARAAGPTVPAPRSPRPRSSCSAWRARDSRCVHRRARRWWRCRCPVSTTSTTRSRRWRLPRGLGVGLERIVDSLNRVEAVFGRVETIDIAGRPAGDPPDQEPGRCERGSADAGAGGRP